MYDRVLKIPLLWTHDAYYSNTLRRHLQIPHREKFPYKEIFCQYFSEYSPNTGKTDGEKPLYFW